MKNTIFNSDRRFVLFDMTVSHGQLLLRSQKNESYEHNIDIIFYNTKFIQLYYSFDSIAIKKISIEKNEKTELSFLRYMDNDTDFLFQLSDKGSVFYIVASFFKVFENSLDFNESSLSFLLEKGKEITISD